MGKQLSSLQLKPLAVKCTDSDCKNDLHCFKATAKMVKDQSAGVCRECGVKLIDWERLHARDFSDRSYTFQSLKAELIRHHFWHVEIAVKAVNYARRKGTTKLRSAVYSRLECSIGKPGNPYDGRQTPMAGSSNPIHYAQHATASCCRKCAEYWHNISTTKTLTADELDYLTDLAMLFLEERIPNLTVEGEYVPPVRSTLTP